MAYNIPQGSPAVTIREIDLTGVVPTTLANVGAYVGNFRWGPVDNPTLVSNEAGLVSQFGAPSSEAESIDFLTAASFLQYSDSMYIVRTVTSAAKNAQGDDSADLAALQIKDKVDFYTKKDALDTNNVTFVARYPGVFGNSLKVEVCPPSAFAAWTYRGNFDEAPATSYWASLDSDGTANMTKNDEAHVVVVDAQGLFTGATGSVIEKFPFVSLAPNAKAADNTSLYIQDIINERSQYIYMAGFGVQADSDGLFDQLAGTSIVHGTSQNYAGDANGVVTVTLEKGVASGALTTSEIATGVDTLVDPETVPNIDFAIVPGMANSTDQATVTNDFVASLAGDAARKDCVITTSPGRDDIINVAQATQITNAVDCANGFTRSSYLVVDGMYYKAYDKYNDRYIWIPAAGAVAGLMAATAVNSAPWFSPAGQRRGRLLGVSNLAYNPTKAQRDTLYKAGINPIAILPGQGVLLYGDKTFLNRPSAFDRINVRKLFLYCERAIGEAAKNILFEFNDEFTRAEFVGIVEPFLREIQGGRGITDFLVVCDETNNTPAVIDRNEFVASILIKPARSINYITLNFVAVRTGVNFDEVVGVI